jgi:serine protease inhibitor
MVENRIKDPAMTLSPSVLVATMLMCCHAVGRETLEASVEDVKRATLYHGRGTEIIAELETGFASILHKLRAFQSRDFLRLSHSIWIPGELPFENEYAIKVARSLGAQVFRARDISSTALRSWAQGQLHEDELKCSFPDVSPSEITLLSLFRMSAAWSTPFEREHTESHTLVEDSRVRRLELMVQRGEYAYHEGAAYKVVSLPTDGPLECLFILPTVSLSDLLKALAEDYKLLFSPLSGSRRKLVLKIPRFRVDEGDDICAVLAHALIFRRLLDFTVQYPGLTKARTYIRHIIHKVFLHVTEDGINASSATPAGAPSEARRVHQQPSDEVVEFSKSFVFMVRDRIGCDILLATVVNGSDPLSNSAQADAHRPATPPLRPMPSARAQAANKAQPATQDAVNSKDIPPTLPDGFRLNQPPVTPRQSRSLSSNSHQTPPLLTPKNARSNGHRDIASPRTPVSALSTEHMTQNSINPTRRPTVVSPRGQPQSGELLQRLVRDIGNRNTSLAANGQGANGSFPSGLQSYHEMVLLCVHLCVCARARARVCVCGRVLPWMDLHPSLHVLCARGFRAHMHLNDTYVVSVFRVSRFFSPTPNFPAPSLILLSIFLCFRQVASDRQASGGSGYKELHQSQTQAQQNSRCVLCGTPRPPTTHNSCVSFFSCPSFAR